jgi:xylulokinase
MTSRRTNLSEFTLGVDLGTSGVKVGLLNLATMGLEAVSQREYTASAEQDPTVLWECTLQAVQELAGSLSGSGTILAIGMTGQMHGAVLFDAEGRLIAPIYTWMEANHSSPEIVREMKQVMRGRVSEATGTDIASGYTAAILYGIKKSDQGLFRRIAHFVLPVDFLRGRFLGSCDYTTDPTNACSTGLFQPKAKSWHTKLIDELQLPMGAFPRVRESSHLAGRLPPEQARLLGLEAGAAIIFGGGDNQMGMLGSGLIDAESPLLVNIGTAAQVSKVIGRYKKYFGLDTRNFFNRKYALVGASLAGGGSYQWLRDTFNRENGTQFSYADMDSLAAQVEPGADGLIFCPGPTRSKPDRKRGFFGNQKRIGSLAYRARAAMEGVLMDLQEANEHLIENDQTGFVHAAGKGLQRSGIWVQIASDLFGRTVRVIPIESPVYGAAILAGFGIGRIQDLGKAVQRIKMGAEYSPGDLNRRFYRDEFAPYWSGEVQRAQDS